MQDTPAGGFSRPIALAELASEGMVLALRATEAERRSITRAESQECKLSSRSYQCRVTKA